MDKGIVMAGGGALLKGIDKLLTEETGMPVHIAEDPMLCVALGTGMALENIELLKRVRVMVSPRRLN